jgi:hypothetical protein
MNTPELINRTKAAIESAKVTRGRKKGLLLAKCPPVGTDAAAAWQALMSFANPYKVGFGHLFFMRDEQKAIYEFIREQVKQLHIDCRGLDRDRKALETLGVW